MQMASVGGQSNQYKRKPSCRSGIMYDDYDIVDPGTLCDAERRNTETLVRDGRFRHFSTVSITDSDISIDDIKEVRCSKEHEI
ncbi:TPA: hypothetical protein N0F65_004932 [Lagenidium giganteum]|uniref:Uncharacterized protein n=1 Tax=Lagenidium giganteum TaxID=4803 RepID=A0AAV2YUB9_9STRA|nr:TPA: hypothetical protein N0F65_004932 [Lagenidium giganteum]